MNSISITSCGAVADDTPTSGAADSRSVDSRAAIQNCIDQASCNCPCGWGARTQTLTLGGSTDGTTFTTLKSSAAHTFDPSTRNTVTLTFPAATQRYFRVTITANSGWPAGQVSEFQIWTS